MEYKIINIRDFYKENEQETLKMFARFKCEFNPDIEKFLKLKSIEFSKKGIAETFLVISELKNKDVIVGYFSLAYKITRVRKDVLKGKIRRRMLRFVQSQKDKEFYLVALPLIGQLSKNYYMKYNELISGDALLNLACEKIIEAQRIISGRFAFLECVNHPKLKEFYEKNGFIYFGQRQLDRDEKKYNKCEYLLKMLRDLS